MSKQDLIEATVVLLVPFIVIGSIVYLAFSFGCWTLDASEWGSVPRSFCAAISIVSTFLWIFRDDIFV